MGKISAKTKAAMHQASSALSGEAGILNTLQKEHEEVSSLLEDCLAASEKRRQSLYATMRENLLIHATCEETVFYPACRQYAKLAQLMDQAQGDHEEVEMLLGRLDRTTTKDAAWKQMLGELQTSVDRHVDMEENQIFPQVQETFDNEQLRQLDAQFKQRKKELKKQSVPLDSQSSTDIFAQSAR